MCFNKRRVSALWCNNNVSVILISQHGFISNTSDGLLREPFPDIVRYPRTKLPTQTVYIASA